MLHVKDGFFQRPLSVFPLKNNIPNVKSGASVEIVCIKANPHTHSYSRLAAETFLIRASMVHGPVGRSVRCVRNGLCTLLGPVIYRSQTAPAARKPICEQGVGNISSATRQIGRTANESHSAHAQLMVNIAYDLQQYAG